jgi:hypothetical protein
MLYTLGRIQKTRAKMQSTASLETKEATVSRTYSNGTYVFACDVRVKGQQKTLFQVPNASPANWTEGDTVLVNLTWGNSNRPKIVGAAGSTTANSAASANSGLINGGSGTGSTSLSLAGIPFVLESASTVATGGYIIEPGSNVILTPQGPSMASGGLMDGFLTVAMRRLVLTYLPPIKGLLDGTLLDLVDSYGNGLGMYRLSAAIGGWVREDVGGGGTPLIDNPLIGTVNGINTTFTLPKTPVNGFEIFADGVRLASPYDFTASGILISTVIAPITWIHANVY